MPESTILSGTERTDQAPGVERRASVRYQCSQSATFASAPNYERFVARVKDISITGVGLVVSTHIEPGTYLIVEMKTRARGILLTLLARVVHSTPQSENSWNVGCELVNKPTEEQLQSLV